MENLPILNSRDSPDTLPNFKQSFMKGFIKPFFYLNYRGRYKLLEVPDPVFIVHAVPYGYPTTVLLAPDAIYIWTPIQTFFRLEGDSGQEVSVVRGTEPYKLPKEEVDEILKSLSKELPPGFILANIPYPFENPTELVPSLLSRVSYFLAFLNFEVDFKRHLQYAIRLNERVKGSVF